MGQESSPAGAPVNETRDPDQIRREIESTRDRMGDTVDAIGYKADVKSRAKDKLTDTKESITGRISDTKDSITGTVSDRSPDAGQVKDRGKRAAGVAQENPLGLALGSIAVGFIAGLLIPSTRVEDEKLGPVADQVKEQAKQTGQEALERGKDVAQQAASAAKDTAQEAGQQHAEELKSSSEDRAQETRSSVQDEAGSRSG